MNKHWPSSENARLVKCPKALRACLTESGSLTQYLNQFCDQELSLRLLNQSWQKPTLDECKLLNIQFGKYAIIREIILGCENLSWVYARTVIPNATYQKRKHQLSRLGLVPLANILFSDRNISRQDMSLHRLQVSTLAISNVINTNELGTDALWSRRSIFDISDSLFLVQEVFLPGIYPCIHS